MIKNPKVSIIVPNYNHAKYLSERFQSIINQTFSDYELIVLDDCSSDDSLLILQQWIEKFIQPTRLIVNEKNSGSPFHQWNLGVSKARGQYIWIAESDDACAPTLLAENVKMLDSNPQVGIAFCQSILVDEKSERLHSFNENYTFTFKTDRWKQSFVNTGRKECTQYLIHHNTLPNASGILFRKEAYQQAGGGDPKFKLNGDWMLYARILTHWDLAYQAHELNYFRVHTQTQRQKANKEAYAYKEIIEIQDYIHKTFNDIDQKVFFKARKEVSHWWIGSLYRQNLWRRKYWKVNVNLYKTFSPYHQALWWNITYHGIFIGIRFLIKRLGLYKFAKSTISRLFPGKHFNP